jgi:hypothetical protein
MNDLAAVAPSGTKSPFAALPGATSIVWLYALIGLIAAMQLSMVTGRSVNWDEFWFYSQIEVVARGEFIQPLQTIHTRFFAGWLPDMPGSEIDHIILARFFMLLCLAITAAGIYAIAEKFSDKRTALLSVALYLGAGFVLHHGTSFRVDPIVTACLTTGLVIAARTRLSLPAIVALGALIGLAAMVTIKFVLWAPAFAGMALWRWQDEDWDWRYPLRWIAAGVVALATFALLYALHAGGASEQANTSAAGTLGHSSAKMFGILHSPYLFMMGKAAMTAMPLTITALLMPSTVLRLDIAPARRIAIMALWLPLLTPLYYHNSAPYVYAFLLPPVVIACAFTIPLIVKRYGETLFAIFIALSAFAVWVVDERGVTAKQKQLIDVVHAIFPEPVPYFDCCGMIGTFPKANTFMTSWGTQIYLQQSSPPMLMQMQRMSVPMVLDNNDDFGPLFEDNDTRRFHPQDAAALRETYRNFWGPVYLAGTVLDPGEARRWNVRVPGTYTIEGELQIAGRDYSAGELVQLERGEVQLSAGADGAGGLIWGANLELPLAPPAQLYWTGF